LGQYDNSLGQVSWQKTPTAYSDFLGRSIVKVATLDFTSERKAMSTVVKGFTKPDLNSLLIKGAPERIIAKCSSYKKADNQIGEFNE